MSSRLSLSSKLFLVIILLMVCSQVAAISGSVLSSASYERQREVALEKQVAELKEKVEKMQKTMYKFISTLMDDKSDGEDGKNHVVKKRDLSPSNETQHFDYGYELQRLPIHALSSLRGPPGRDGRDGRDGAAATPGKNGTPGATGAVGSPGRDGLPGIPGEGGNVYTRWGRTTCGNSSTLLYKGFAGGSQYNYPGGGVNYQCMPLTPEHSDRRYTNGYNNFAYLSGAEYHSQHSGIFSRGTHDQNVPCARCYTNNRVAVVMIPAIRTCPDKWNKEYEGFLMTEFYRRNHQTTFECMDADPERVVGGETDTNGAAFYFIRPRCGTVIGSTHHCPPYDAVKELTCVVCSK